ncbi:MAG: hypothetical protein F4X55_02405 [Candidatus Dadabacteria bacterium]|nr:hypothetical protein [Candidatus Dadabacteria bacterium]MYC39857.1 hypothetical protein [Candidatus Dadabacteria bacterium]
MGCEFWSGVISAAIVGFITLLGVYKTLKGQEERDEKRRKDRNKAVKKAFYQELNTLWEKLIKPVEPFWVEYEETRFLDFRSFLSPDYLTIYRSNANHIGHIDDPELRDKIVNVYILLQALIDGFKVNTEFLSEYNEADDRYNETIAKQTNPSAYQSQSLSVKYGTEAAGFEALRDHALQKLKGYAPELKKQYDDFADSIEELLDMLEKDILKQELPKPKWSWEQ